MAASRKLDVATKSLRTWMDQQERGKLKSSLGASKLTVDQQRIRELESQFACDAVWSRVVTVDGVVKVRFLTTVHRLVTARSIKCRFNRHYCSRVDDVL